MGTKSIASRILELNQMWIKAEKSVIANNIVRRLLENNPELLAASSVFNAKLDKLSEITGSNKQTVYAWINNGRKNVKVPFLKLCEIAVYLNVDIEDLMEDNNEND